MFTPIHRALGVPSGDFDWALVSRAVGEAVKEDADLDWKSEFYETKNPKWATEAAKDVAAMANTGGGWIVFGVADHQDAASGITSIGWARANEEQLRSVAATHIRPPVLDLEFYVVEEPDGGGRVVGVRVPDSSESPHLVWVQDRFMCPRRNGAHTIFMDERAIEAAYKQRFALRRDRAAAFQDMREDALSRDGYDKTAGLVAMAIPREPRMAARINERAADAILKGARSRCLHLDVSWDHRILPETTISVPCYRGRRFQDTDRLNVVCSLHDDGSVWLASRIGKVGIGIPQHALPTTVATGTVYKFVADFLVLMTEQAKALGATAAYSGQIELVGPFPLNICHFQILGANNGADPLAVRDPSELPKLYRFRPVPFEMVGDEDDEGLKALAEQIALDINSQGEVGLSGVTSIR